MKRLVLIVIALILIGVIGFFGVAPGRVDRIYNTFAQAAPYQASEAARNLHARLFVADLHADQLLWTRDLLDRSAHGHVDVPRLLEGQVALQVFSVVTKSPWAQNYDRNPGNTDRITPLVVAQRWPVRTWTSLKERALYQAEKLQDAATRSNGRLVLIRTQGDLDAYLARRTRDPDAVAALLAMEGLHPLEGDFANVDVFYEAGYRMLGLTHFFDNEVAGSAHGLEKGGLTDLGRRVVRRMEERRILVDLAHVAPKAIDDVLAMATRPVVVSHTGVQGTCPGPRNLTDRHLQRIAELGGVVGIGFWDGAVCGISAAAIVRAIRYAVDHIGVEHVALGSDFDGSVHTPFDVTGLVLLTEALLEDGFTEDEIRLIMGGNILRLLRASLPPS